MPNEWNVTLDENGTLRGEEAFSLFLQGRDAWNAFMEEHPETYVNFSGFDFSSYCNGAGGISFSRFRFPKGASFAVSNFGGHVSFRAAIFSDGKVAFDQTNFGDGEVSFEQASFSNCNVSFNNANFGDGTISFNKTKFEYGQTIFWNMVFGEGYISFEDAIFSANRVSFNNTNFGSCRISFLNTKFDGDAFFRNAIFSNTVSFTKVQCDSLDFSKATFKKDTQSDSKITFSMERANISQSLLLPNLDFRAFDNVSLRGTSIGTLFDIEGSQFGQLPDLTATTINGHFSVDRIHVDTPKTFTKEDATKARRLKELAKKSEDRPTQLDMLALELDALSATKKPLNPSRLLNSLYRLISCYGRSILRPSITLFLVFSVCSCLYFGLSKKDNGAWQDAAQLSFSQSLPFLSLSRTVAGTSLTSLYGTEQVQQESSIKIQKPPYYNAVENIGLAQNLLSYICLFFIGLGIRNRFKL